MTTLTHIPHVNKYAIAAAVNAEVQRRAVRQAHRASQHVGRGDRAPTAPADHIPMTVIVDELRDIAQQIPGDQANAQAQLYDLIADLTSQSPNH
jgi:hypothetical protein